MTQKFEHYHLMSHSLLNFLKTKNWTGITLLGLTADTEITEVHPPLGVAARHLCSLREQGMVVLVHPCTSRHSGILPIRPR